MYKLEIITFARLAVPCGQSTAIKQTCRHNIGVKTMCRFMDSNFFKNP